MRLRKSSNTCAHKPDFVRAGLRYPDFGLTDCNTEAGIIRLTTPQGVGPVVVRSVVVEALGGVGNGHGHHESPTAHRQELHRRGTPHLRSSASRSLCTSGGRRAGEGEGERDEKTGRGTKNQQKDVRVHIYYDARRDRFFIPAAVADLGPTTCTRNGACHYLTCNLVFGRGHVLVSQLSLQNLEGCATAVSYNTCMSSGECFGKMHACISSESPQIGSRARSYLKSIICCRICVYDLLLARIASVGSLFRGPSVHV